jgi:flavorubredoxin
MINIKGNIHWVGSIDWNLRNFHGYLTPYGTTYNAYLIVDEKPTLIDTVKYYGFEEMLSRIKEVIEPARIKYIVSNHAELDHSGSIAKLLKYCPQAEVVCSPKGQEGLKKHFKEDWRFKVVNTAETITIGAYTLTFFLMPMVHWPDSMATYLGKEKILFPNDAFGQHYASSERFADSVGQDIVFREVAKYYANIVLPYGSQVLKALEILKSVPIEMICPSHGLGWRKIEDIEKVVALYRKWANYESDKSVVIIYDTMWHSTEKMALTLYQLLAKENVPIKLFNLQVSHISDIITDIMLSRVILLGSPILNNRILPTMGALLTYMKGLKPKNRYAMTFGSYGWSSGSFKEFEDSLKEAGLELLSEGRYIQYVPTQEELDGLVSLVPRIKALLYEKA